MTLEIGIMNRMLFNYALHLDGENSQLTSSFKTSPNWPEYSATETTPKSIQFRFKTPGIPTFICLL